MFRNLVPLLPCYLLDIIRNLIIYSTLWTVIVSHSSLKTFENKHNIHHQKFKYNYGLFISDYIFNTKYKKKI